AGDQHTAPGGLTARLNRLLQSAFLNFLGSINACRSAIATCQASQLVERNSVRSYVLERKTAIELLLGKPAPGSLPKTPWIDGQCIQCHDHRRQTAKGRVC